MVARSTKFSYQQVRTWTLCDSRRWGESGPARRTGAESERIRFKNQSWRKAQIEIEQLKHKLYLAEMGEMTC